MPAFQQKIRVEMEDGQVWEAVADQRDLAQYEGQPFYDPARTHTMVRFMAWSASRRAGRTSLDWTGFTQKCVEAGDPDTGEDVELDPTNSGQPAAS